ncbi:DUF5993 family protein [Aquabacter spiritensis]|uniref:Uncharacterized protein n=1 Tax=Aquabacter spiritensis TaxID=933073 RepID=A0A4R3LUS7_9HYPH|nr:DUF5993 family protein [Aquabacter spiritensis]TCT04281.1 hypothetical protein EDC64_10797 [Aquabacter spiritensis]
MMSLPFFGIFLALALVMAGRRTASIVVFGASFVMLLVLFKLHATDPLNIAL